MIFFAENYMHFVLYKLIASSYNMHSTNIFCSVEACLVTSSYYNALLIIFEVNIDQRDVWITLLISTCM